MSDDFGPAAASLIEMRDRIARREWRAEMVVQSCLERIERLNPSLNAFNEIFGKRSLERAMEIDDLLDAGKSPGPLAGCPIAIKDNLCLDFGRTTCSSRILESFESPYTATAVQRLVDAGAVILGKTNLDEFGMGSSGEHSVSGVTRNPWNPDFVTGGSSGGSAAAVAAGLCPAALGSDTGGSVRQPAALCGVIGFKPTYGAVSRHGLVAFASSLDQVGPMARSVDDAALLASIITGHDLHDSTSHPRADELCFDEPIDLTRLRIGRPAQFRSEANDLAVNEMYEKAVETYRSLGAEIIDLDLSMTRYGVPTYYVICTAEASSNLARYDGIRYGRRASLEAGETLVDLYCRSRTEGFGEEVQRRIMLGAYALSAGYFEAYYLRASKVRRLIAEELRRAFEQCDAIIGPTSPTPAFPIGEKLNDPLRMYLCDIYTVTVSLAGIPAISMPAGFADTDTDTDTGAGGSLPVGLQVIGPAFSEPRLLRIAGMFEAATDFASKRPNVDAILTRNGS